VSLEYILLGLLGEPASGYDLKKIFDTEVGYFWAAELSQIYPTLKRLEKQHLLRSHHAAAKRGPRRIVYETTAAGNRALRAWLQAGPEVGDERQAFVAKLYFMPALDDLGATLRLLSALRQRFATRLEALRSLEKLWEESDPRYPNELPTAEFHKLLALRKGLFSLQAHVEWADDSIRLVRQRADPAGVDRKAKAKPEKSDQRTAKVRV
jgi:PadR family transcriptional regulator, regulatory protein AphA